jgi:hypothetical protein
MPIPFARNTGSTITGTIQIGNLAIGVPTEGFGATGLPWWMSPNENSGHVIASEVSSGNQPTPVAGVNASVQFWRTNSRTDSSFIDLAQYVAKRHGSPQTFTTGSLAKTWLNNNGYWTSWDLQVGDIYGGGVVGYVFQPGDSGYNPNIQRGLIASPNDVGGSFSWGCSGTSIPTTEIGGLNTITLLNGCATRPIAASVAKNYNEGGYTDWFLPNLDELVKIILNKNLIGNFGNGIYWSSSQVVNQPTTNAWSVALGDALALNGPKGNPYGIRAVRYF